jgi:phage-related protein
MKAAASQQQQVKAKAPQRARLPVKLRKASPRIAPQRGERQPRIQTASVAATRSPARPIFGASLRGVLARALGRTRAPAVTPAPSSLATLARNEPALSPLREAHGEALPGSMLRRLQRLFGTGLDRIRLYRGARAEAVAADAGARALTVGEHVVLGRTASPDDIGLMAHETAHVLQQRHGGDTWSPAALEAEAVAAAQAARRGERFEVRGRASEPRVQRADEEESPGLIERLILDAVQEFAPDLMPIIKQGPLAWIEDKLNRAVDALFDAVTAPVRTVTGIVQSLEQHFGNLVAWMREAGPKIAAGDCKPLSEAAEKIEQVITGLAAPVVDKIKELAGKAKDFFSGLWDRFGAPAWDFLKRLGGEAWDKLQALARWIWDKTAPVRDRISSAWTWLKNKLGIGEGPEGQDGILQWVQRKAEQVWDQKIKPFVDRFRKPLTVIGGVLLLLSPAGPFIVIGAGVAGLIMGIRWIKQHLVTRDGVVSQRDFLRGTILPALMAAVGAVTGALNKAAAFVLDKLNGVMGGLGEVVGAVAGSIFRVAISIVQWVADQFRALVAWATDKLKGLADLVASGLERLKVFLEPVFSVLGDIASAITDLFRLPLLIAGKLWRLIPACIRNPFVDFLVNQILKRIPIFKDLLDLADLWSQIQAEVMAIIRRVFTDHDLIGALKASFRLVVKVLKIPFELALTVIAKAETAWDAVLAKPLDFIKNILRALRLGFGNFFSNILGHLGFGVQGWLFGQLKELQVQPPASWTDIWAIFRMVTQILGLTQRHIFELIGKRVGPEIAAKLEKAWNILVGVWSWIAEAMKDPASLGKHVLERIRDIGKMVLDAAIGWIVENIVKKVTARLLTMLDPTGIMAVVNALIAVYAAVKSAIQYIAELLGILNRVLDTVIDVVGGVIAGAAKSLEDAMHTAMPVMIGFLANFLGLGGIGKKIRDIIAGIRQKIDDAILWLIDQALKVGRAILNALFGKKDEEPDDQSDVDKALTVGQEQHTLRLQVVNGRLSLSLASGTFMPIKERLADVAIRYEPLFKALGRDDELNQLRAEAGALLADIDQAEASNMSRRARRTKLDEFSQRFIAMARKHGLRTIDGDPMQAYTSAPDPKPRYGAVDTFGRASKAGATLSWRTKGTSTSPELEVGGKKLPPGFESGHLVAASLGGSNSDAKNFAPMSGETNRNRGGIADIERALRRATWPAKYPPYQEIYPPYVIDYEVRPNYLEDNLDSFRSLLIQRYSAAPSAAEDLYRRAQANAPVDNAAILAALAVAPPASRTVSDLQAIRAELVRHFVPGSFQASVLVQQGEGVDIPASGAIENRF